MVVPGTAGLVGVPGFEAMPEADALIVFEIPGRFGMIGVTEGAWVVVALEGVE